MSREFPTWKGPQEFVRNVFERGSLAEPAMELKKHKILNVLFEILNHFLFRKGDLLISANHTNLPIENAGTPGVISSSVLLCNSRKLCRRRS